jgi:lysosomal alpha-mannosidase
MNYIWRPMNSSLGDSVEIFTGAMRDHYCWIPGFWTDDKFDGDDPVESDETLETFNADYKTELMYNYVMEMVEGYQGNHMLVPMGCDFAFQNARLNFRSTDNLIDYFNSHVDNMTLLYSTPSMYLDSLKS